jgi:capsid protein
MAAQPHSVKPSEPAAVLSLLEAWCALTGRDVHEVRDQIARQARERALLFRRAGLAAEAVPGPTAGPGELAEVRQEVEQLRRETVEALRRLAGRCCR